MLAASKGDALEIDELCVRKSPSLWLWIVRSRKTGQVVASVLGQRSVATLAVLWSRVPAPYRRKLVYTDGWKVYKAFFAPWQHRPTNKGSDGLIGRTSRVEGLNTLWRARVSGIVRRSCGVCPTRAQDVWERFGCVREWHNRRCLKRWNKQN